jgi:peptidoglycan/LPS O-acetylase OafA/YrhL
MKPGERAAKMRYIPTLDGWRAVAILAVIFSHSQVAFHAAGIDSFRFLLVASWFRLGVDVFFAISGYLICTQLLVEFEAQGGISLPGFYLRRAFRILPLYFFYLVLLSGLSLWAGVPSSPGSILSSLFFVRNYIDPGRGVYTNHFWSLAVEEHFYLLWPFFLACSGPKRALWLTPVLALLVEIWRGLDGHFQLTDSFLPHAGILWRTDTRLDALLWGCFAAIVCFRHPPRLPAWAPFLILGVLVAGIVGNLPLLPLFLALIFPLLIVSTLSNPGAPISRLLETPPLRWIGRLSYSLYIWQTILLQQGERPDPAWLAAIKHPPWNYAVILAIAIASHYLLERPMIRLGRLVQKKFVPAETSPALSHRADH